MEIVRHRWSQLARINSANPDLALTLVALAFVLLGMITLPDGSPEGTTFRPYDGFAAALIVVQTAAIAFLRRWPFPSAFVAFGAVLIQASFDYDLNAVSAFSAMFIVFYVTSVHPLRQSVPFGALTAGVVATLFVLNNRHITVEAEDVLFIGGFFVIAWTAGVFVYSRRAKFQQVELYAAEAAERSAHAAEEGAAEERARIARELHDAVGHTLNLIVVQAGAARRVRDTNPDAAYEALRSIENVGRQALNDMDRMLGILRDVETGDHDADGLGPRPGLGRLDALLDEARLAGVQASCEITGAPRKLPVSVDLTAYRVVQEAITNVIKHAPGATADVLVRYEPSALALEVRNGPVESETCPAERNGGGRGLAGMRERVALFGGSMTSSPITGGGFVVKVSIPLNGAD